MNFRRIFLLSLFFHKKEYTVIEQIQHLNKQIYALKEERRQLHKKLYIESQEKVFKMAKEQYSQLKIAKTLPIFI